MQQVLEVQQVQPPLKHDDQQQPSQRENSQPPLVDDQKKDDSTTSPNVPSSAQETMPEMKQSTQEVTQQLQ